MFPLVEDVEAFVVDDEGVALRRLDLAVGLYVSNPDSGSLGKLVGNEEKDLGSVDAREVYAVVEPRDNPGLGRIDAEEVAKGGEIMRVGRPKQSDKLYIVGKTLGAAFRPQLRFEVYDGHYVVLGVQQV